MAAIRAQYLTLERAPDGLLDILHIDLRRRRTLVEGHGNVGRAQVGVAVLVDDKGRDLQGPIERDPQLRALVRRETDLASLDNRMRPGDAEYQ